MVAMAVALALSSSCSLVTSRGPSRAPSDGAITCYGPVWTIVGDGGAALVAGIIGGSAAGDFGNPEAGGNARGITVLGLGTAAILIASAVYGGVIRARCMDARSSPAAPDAARTVE
jgi:hypothetical protein